MTATGRISKVYLKYGIVPVGRKGDKFLPGGDASVKVDVAFDDGKKVHKLTYDPVNRRFFGVRGWYMSHGAESGDLVTIEPVNGGKSFRLRFVRSESAKTGPRGKGAHKQTGRTRKKRRDFSSVGDPINYRGLIYAPVNEAGVVLLFGMLFEEMGMIVEEVKSGFPDATVRIFDGKGWVRKLAEFEYESLNFKKHKHPENECDFIICWRDNWKDCPLRVYDLSEFLDLLPPDKRRKTNFSGARTK